LSLKYLPVTVGHPVEATDRKPGENESSV